MPSIGQRATDLDVGGVRLGHNAGGPVVSSVTVRAHTAFGYTLSLSGGRPRSLTRRKRYLRKAVLLRAVSILYSAQQRRLDAPASDDSAGYATNCHVYIALPQGAPCTS